jgi:hypothetical protein
MAAWTRRSSRSKALEPDRTPQLTSSRRHSHPRPETHRRGQPLQSGARNAKNAKNSTTSSARTGTADATGSRPRPGSFPIASTAPEIPFPADTRKPRQAVRGRSGRGLFVEVGTPVARRPPHRSRRAVFPHRALQPDTLSIARRKVRQFGSVDLTELVACVDFVRLSEYRPGNPSESHLSPQRTEPLAPILQACAIPSREPHRSLPVVPLIPNQRYYGEATVWVWGGSGGTTWGSACGRERGAVPLKTAESQKLHHKWLNRRDLSPLHGTAPRPPPRPTPDPYWAAKGHAAGPSVLRVLIQAAHYQSLTRPASERPHPPTTPPAVKSRWQMRSAARVGSISSPRLSSALAHIRRIARFRELWRGG